MPKSSINAGDIFNTNQGYRVVVVEYNGYNDVLVRFLDQNSHEKIVSAGALRRGAVANPYHRTMFGVGYFGDGKYKSKIGDKRTLEYEAWRCMMKRCYCPKERSRYPTYSDVFVCDEWHNFQNFARWYTEQPGYGEGFDLDKDLRVNNSRVYSPQSCSLVPHEINCILHDNESRRGDYPQGVRKTWNKYSVYISIKGERKYVGLYPTLEEAHRAYKKSRLAYVKEIAEEYKNVLHNEVYENLKSWEISSNARGP